MGSVFCHWVFNLLAVCYSFVQVLVHGMPCKSLLDLVRFILADYGPEAMHSGLVQAYFVGVWFSGNVKIDLRKHIMSHTVDTAHWFLQKSAP